MKTRWILLIGVLALVATACGGGGESVDDGVASLDAGAALGNSAADLDDTPEPADTEEAMINFTQCLRDAGFDVDDPTVDADGNPQLVRPNFAQGGPPEGFREAAQECSDLLEGVTIGRQGQDFTETQDTLVEFTTCMRSNGYTDIEDPDFSNPGQPGQGGGGGGIFGQIDQDDPLFQAAFAECEDILAGFGRGGGFGGGGGGGRGNGGG